MISWNSVKSKIVRRSVVDVELPVLTGVERDIDRQAHESRLHGLRHRGIPVVSPDNREFVRALYRANFGQP